MGKKVKKKCRAPQKEKQKNVSEPSKETSVEALEGLVSVAKEKDLCSHLSKGIDLNALAEKLGSSETVRCEDCREGAADRRGGKGKGKHGKKKGNGSADSKSESRAIWVCLACGHYACGGVGLPTSAQCHALRHTRQTRHPLVLQLENPHLRWCFPCNTLVRSETENGDQKDVFLDVMKLIKGDMESGPKDNADEVVLKTGNGTSENKWENLERQGGYVARGLLNLGNTCFFNSVLQNLLAIDRLRDCFFKLDVSIGPLSMALKKVFIETKPESGLKNVINPRSLFGSICTKCPQFRGYQQHDSHELLRCLLDGLSSEELAMLKRTNSSKENGDSTDPVHTFVDAVFGGQISSTVCCLECGHSSTVYEPYLDLSLPVPTKKPISKKTQQTTRSKKPKLPPKRLAKNRPKLNKSVESVSDASTSKELPQQLQSSSSVVQNSTLAEECENKPSVPAEEFDNRLSEQAEETSALFTDFTWMDYLEPEAPLEDYDLTANDTVATCQDSENKDGGESGDQVLPLSNEPDTKPNFSSINPWEDENEIPSLVQSSEVLLLPYKEENENSTAVEFEAEASSMICGSKQEDFDGFGSLFDEPEVFAGPVSGPCLSNDVLDTGFMAIHSSESDPDEVDDSNAPVSVETCMAHFTKPEILSKENAWHCENCSKTLFRQKLLANKQLNGCGTQSDIVSGNNDTETVNDNDNIQSLANSKTLEEVPEFSAENHTEKENGQTHEPSSSSGTYETCNQESLRNNSTDSGYVDEQSSSGSIADEEIKPEGNQDIEESEDEVDIKTVKVKRDATKRVLINKAPPILTIHLKRFSQDARGRLSKLNGHVTFKELVDLKPYIDARCVDDEVYNYRLIGVVEHQGTMRGGHYVAYVRGKIEKENEGGSVWFHASDAYVRETNLEEVLRCEAYILFYEKV